MDMLFVLILGTGNIQCTHTLTLLALFVFHYCMYGFVRLVLLLI